MIHFDRSGSSAACSSAARSEGAAAVCEVRVLAAEETPFCAAGASHVPRGGLMLPSRAIMTSNGVRTLSRCAAMTASAKKGSAVRGSSACIGTICRATCGIRRSATLQRALQMPRSFVRSLKSTLPSKMWIQSSSGKLSNGLACASRAVASWCHRDEGSP